MLVLTLTSRTLGDSILFSIDLTLKLNKNSLLNCSSTNCSISDLLIRPSAGDLSSVFLS